MKPNYDKIIVAAGNKVRAKGQIPIERFGSPDRLADASDLVEMGIGDALLLMHERLKELEGREKCTP
jgi:hypothetical protein